MAILDEIDDDVTEPDIEEDIDAGSEPENELQDDAEPEAADSDEPAPRTVISIGEPPAEEPEVESKSFRELRQRYKEVSRRLREVESAKAVVPTALPELPAKPTLASAGYDDDKFIEETENWLKLKADHDKAKETAEAQKKQESAEWEAASKAYGNARAVLSKEVDGFEDAEAEVANHLTPVQQSILVSEFKRAPEIVYALGRSPAELKRLSGISNPIKFSIAVAELQGKIRVSKTTAPAPEPRIRAPGSPGATISNDKTLEKLRADAEKTGDRSKVAAYIRKQNQQRR